MGTGLDSAHATGQPYPNNSRKKKNSAFFSAVCRFSLLFFFSTRTLRFNPLKSFSSFLSLYKFNQFQRWNLKPLSFPSCLPVSRTVSFQVRFFVLVSVVSFVEFVLFILFYFLFLVILDRLRQRKDLIFPCWGNQKSTFMDCLMRGISNSDVDWEFLAPI